MLTKNIVTVAEGTGVTLSEGPTALDAEKVGACRRFYFRYRGTCAYNDFVKFLLDVHATQLPCAFKKIELKARSGTSVDLEVLVIFTVRD